MYDRCCMLLKFLLKKVSSARDSTLRSVEIALSLPFFADRGISATGRGVIIDLKSCNKRHKLSGQNSKKHHGKEDLVSQQCDCPE